MMREGGAWRGGRGKDPFFCKTRGRDVAFTAGNEPAFLFLVEKGLGKGHKKSAKQSIVFNKKNVKRKKKFTRI